MNAMSPTSYQRIPVPGHTHSSPFGIAPYLWAIVAVVTWASVATADNNLVRTLLEIPQAEGRAYPFSTSRNGWVLVLDGTDECMRWMKAGNHKVNGSAGRPLVVRVIPEIVYSEIGYRPSPFLEAFPRYDVQYLEKIGLLRNVNVVLELNPEPGFDIPKWKASGRKIRVRAGSEEADPKRVYEYWANHRGMHDPYDGIQISEYDGWVGSLHLPHYRFLIDAARKISQDKRFEGKQIVPYTVAMYNSPESLEFLKTLFGLGHLQSCEQYLPEQPTVEMANKQLGWMGQSVNKYREVLAGSERHSILALGYMSAPPETLDNCPNANFLVFMDMQMKALATDPTYKDLYGVEWYHSAYADEEALRWSVQLIRHYCIEGKQDLLSTDPYLLTHLQNGDFAEGTTGWTVEPAEPGSMAVRSHEGLSCLETRFPQVEQGKTFLWLRRSAAGPNILRQTIRSLKSGRAYSLKMMVCDYRDLTQGRDERREHKPSVQIEGAQMIPAASFREVFASGRAGHGFEKFNAQNSLWITYHRLVFRAAGTTAQLTISDWESGDKPGGAVGQELALNYIGVQPYLEQ